MFKLKNNRQNTKHQVETSKQTNQPLIEAGMWVFETKTPLVPMYISQILEYGMCEVIYGKSLPFRVYKKRVANLRPLKPEELHLVNNLISRKIEQAAKSA